MNGGEEGIRTPDTLSGMPVFKTGAINHSATSPLIQFYYSSTVSGHASVTQPANMPNPSSLKVWGVCTLTSCLFVGRIGLQNQASLIERQSRVAWVKFSPVSVAQIAKKIRFPLAVGEKLSVDLGGVESGHRSTIEAKSAGSQYEVSPSKRAVSECRGFNECGVTKEQLNAYLFAERALEVSRGTPYPMQ